MIDFDKEFTDTQIGLIGVSNEAHALEKEINTTSESISRLIKEVRELDYTIPEEPQKSKPLITSSENYSKEFFSNLTEQFEEQIIKEINSGANLLTVTTRLDYTVAFAIGVIGAVVDMLFVKIPSDTKYLNQFEQKGSEITKWLKTLGVGEDGKLNDFFKGLEQATKVSFDASTKNNLGNYNEEISGFYPKTHRLMSLGHDPFYGLIFGLLDMLNGNITFIDSKGVIHSVAIEKYQEVALKEKVFAPFIWLGHILSDICTKMGIPIPGWGFTQLLQFGSFGENKRTIADVTRYMYLEGYDLRHFATMGVVPGVIDLCTKVYFKITLAEKDSYSLLYQQNLNEVHDRIRLQKILFMSHSVATSSNILKVFMYHGNPTALNFNEILIFIKHSIEMMRIQQRKTDAEKVIRNRNRINEGWKKFK